MKRFPARFLFILSCIAAALIFWNPGDSSVAPTESVGHSEFQFPAMGLPSDGGLEIAGKPEPSGALATSDRVSASPLSVNASAKVVANALAALPVIFEQNIGQADASIGFLSRSAGHHLSFTNSEIIFSVAGNRTAMRFCRANLTPRSPVKLRCPARATI